MWYGRFKPTPHTPNQQEEKIRKREAKLEKLRANLAPKRPVASLQSAGGGITSSKGVASFHDTTVASVQSTVGGGGALQVASLS